VAEKDLNYNVKATGVDEVKNEIVKLNKSLVDGTKKATDAAKTMESAWAKAGKVFEALKNPLKTLGDLGTKAGAAAEAAGKGITDSWNKAVGATGRLTATLTGFGLGVLLVKQRVQQLSNEWRNFGAESSKRMATLTEQFRALLGSVELAKQRVRELLTFAASTPFLTEQVVAANRTLQTLTGGMLATQKAMRMIGDAAAATGADLDQVSTWVGRLYGALEAGEPIGEAVTRLRELGVITGQSAYQLQAMSQSAAGFTETWMVVERQLLKSQGAMENLSKTVAGLETTVGDAKSLMEGAFGKAFEDIRVEELEAAIATFNALTPIVENFGTMLASSISVFERMGLSMQKTAAETLASSKQMSDGFGAAVAGGMGLFFGAMAAGTVSMAEMGISLLFATGTINKAGQAGAFLGGVMERVKLAMNYMAKGNLEMAKAAIGSAVANGVEAASHARSAVATTANTASKITLGTVMVGLSARFKQATAWLAGLTAMQFRNTAATNTQTVAMTLQQRATLAWAATTKAAGTAASVFGNLAAGAFNLIKSALSIMLGTPLGLFITLIAGVAGTLWYLSTSAANAAKKLNEYKKATDDAVNSAKQQIDSIRTQNDLLKTQNSILAQVIQAREELAKAEEQGDQKTIEAAQQRVARLEAQLRRANSMPREVLRLTESQKAFEQGQYEGGQSAQEILRSDRVSQMNPQLQAEEEQKRLEQFQRERQEVLKRNTQRQAVRTQADEQGEKIREMQSERQRLEGQIASVKRKFAQSINYDVYDVEAPIKAKEEYDRTIADLEAKIQALNNDINAGSGALAAAIAAGDPVLQIEELVRAYEDLATAKQDAENKDAKPEDRQAAQIRQQAIEAQINSIDKNAISQALQQAGFDNSEITKAFSGTQRGQEILATARDRLLEKEKEQASPERVAQQEVIRNEKRRAAEEATQKARLDTEEQISGLRMRGLDAELNALEYAKKRLELEKNKKTPEQYKQELQALEAQEQKIRKAAKERAKEAQLKTRADLLAVQLGKAQNAGDVATSSEKQAQLDDVQRAIEGMETQRMADEMFAAGDPEKQKFIDAMNELSDAALDARKALNELTVATAKNEAEQSRAERRLKDAQRGERGALSVIGAETRQDAVARDRFELQTKKEASQIADRKLADEYYESKMKEFDEAQEYERQERKREREKLRARTARQEQIDTLEMRAKAMEESGNSVGARSARERAARIKDEMDKQDREKELRASGAFSDWNSANQYEFNENRIKNLNSEMAEAAQQKDKDKYKKLKEERDAVMAEQAAIKDEAMATTAYRGDKAEQLKDDIATFDAAIAEAEARQENRRKAAKDASPEERRSIEKEYRQEQKNIDEYKNAREKSREELAIVETKPRDEADAIAQREMRRNQIERKFDELPQDFTKVVADSLTSIGGGGGVYSVTNEVELSRERNRLLKELVILTKESKQSDESWAD